LQPLDFSLRLRLNGTVPLAFVISCQLLCLLVRLPIRVPHLPLSSSSLFVVAIKLSLFPIQGFVGLLLYLGDVAHSRIAAISNVVSSRSTERSSAFLVPDDLLLPYLPIWNLPMRIFCPLYFSHQVLP